MKKMILAIVATMAMGCVNTSVKAIDPQSIELVVNFLKGGAVLGGCLGASAAIDAISIDDIPLAEAIGFSAITAASGAVLAAVIAGLYVASQSLSAN